MHKYATGVTTQSTHIHIYRSCHLMTIMSLLVTYVQRSLVVFSYVSSTDLNYVSGILKYTLINMSI